MKEIREHLVPGLIGAVLSGIGLILLSIYSDFLPEIMPALQKIQPHTYLKMLALLFIVFLLVSAVAVVFFLKTKSYKPRSLSGKEFGFEWSAKLNYSGKREEVDIELQWLCPKHRVFFGIKSAEVPETAYHNLWCAKCNRTHEIKSRGDTVYVEEAKAIVERKILSKLRLP